MCLHYFKINQIKQIYWKTSSHILIGLAVFFYSGCRLEANQDKNESATRQYAEQLSHSNHIDEAIGLYKKLLTTNFLSSEEKRLIQLDLTEAYIQTKQFPLALAEFDQLLSDNPRDCQVREKLGDLYLSFARYDAKNNNHQAALNWYVAAIALEPRKRTSLLREYADEVSRSANGPGAVIIYKEILSNSDSSISDVRLANLGLAQIYIWLNNYDEALRGCLKIRLITL